MEKQNKELDDLKKEIEYYKNALSNAKERHKYFFNEIEKKKKELEDLYAVFEKQKSEWLIQANKDRESLAGLISKYQTLIKNNEATAQDLVKREKELERNIDNFRLEQDQTYKNFDNILRGIEAKARDIELKNLAMQKAQDALVMYEQKLDEARAKVQDNLDRTENLKAQTDKNLLASKVELTNSLEKSALADKRLESIVLQEQYLKNLQDRLFQKESEILSREKLLLEKELSLKEIKRDIEIKIKQFQLGDVKL